MSTLFAFDSDDSLWDTHIVIKNLEPISSKTREIIVIRMNRSLAISRHEACEFLSK
jgi:hypothetical protein